MERVATEPRPVGMPPNYLLIEALERYHYFTGTRSRWGSRGGAGDS
jgi:hypothetical protein